jgi:hypothetical protein
LGVTRLAQILQLFNDALGFQINQSKSIAFWLKGMKKYQLK